MTHQILVYPFLWTILTATSLAMDVNASLRTVEEPEYFINGKQNLFQYDFPASGILSPGDWTGDAPINLEEISYKFVLSASQSLENCIVDAHLVREPILFGYDFPGIYMLPPGQWTVPGLPVRVPVVIKAGFSMFQVLPVGGMRGKEEAGLTQTEIDTFKILKEGAPQSPGKRNFTINKKSLKNLKTLPYHQESNLMFSTVEEDKIDFYANELDVFFTTDTLKQVLRLHYYGAPRSQIASILQIHEDRINKMFNVWHLLQKFREVREAQQVQ